MSRAAEIVTGITALLEARKDDLTAEIHDRMGAAVPRLDISTRPEMVSVIEASSQASLQVVARALRAGELPTAMPSEAVAEARVCARLGISLEDLLQTYRISHAELWETAIEQVEAVADASPADRAEALRLFAKVFYSYLDLATDQLTIAYREAATEDGLARRLGVVRDVLEGRAAELRGVAYEIRRTHVGVVAWGGAPSDAIALVGGGGHALNLAVDEHLAWGWVSPETCAVVDGDLPADTFLALGVPGADASGFRASHEQAQQAHAVAVRTGFVLTFYRDVALEALALQIEPVARAFVLAELGPLLSGDRHAPRLRDTLAAYLANGQSATAAAAALGESDRTTAYRVRSAEDRLGAPIRTRAPELALALRWATLLRIGDVVSLPEPARPSHATG